MKRLTHTIWAIAICSTLAICGLPDKNSRCSFPSEHTNAWLFLEELVVTQPQRSVDKWFGKRGASILASLGTSFLAYRGAQKIFGATGKLATMASGGTSATVGLMTYYALQTYLLNQAERNQLIMIMKLWNQLRDRIPHQVWPILDTLYNRWLNDPHGYESHVEDALSYLKAEVYGQFPSRYKTSSESFFTSRNLSVQVRLNLYKLAKATYKTLKELIE